MLKYCELCISYVDCKLIHCQMSSLLSSLELEHFLPRRSKTSTRDLKNTYSTTSPTWKKRKTKKIKRWSRKNEIKIKVQNKLRFQHLNCNEPRTECETGFVSRSPSYLFYTSSQTAVQIWWRISAVLKHTLPDGILASYLTIFGGFV